MLCFGVAEPIAVSKGFPPAFGVFADPNDANAPDPKPKALDAPPVGETNPLPGVALKGFALPCDDVSPPWRFEALREEVSPTEAPLAPLADVRSESLLELYVVKLARNGDEAMRRCRATYFVRLVHRLSIKTCCKAICINSTDARRDASIWNGEGPGLQ